MEYKRRVKESLIYAVEDRTPRVYPWMNEPGGGMVRAGHSVYRLQYHVVWVCKYRRRILNPGVCAYVWKVLPKRLRSMPGVVIETLGFDQDHLHMVMSIPHGNSIQS